MGLSQLGSWPSHTPLATSAVTVQPTAQWVQTLLRIVTCAAAEGGGPASARRTLASGSAPSAPSAPRPPATRPERCKKLRRSRPRSAWLAEAARFPREAWRSLLLISTDASLSADND